MSEHVQVELQAGVLTLTIDRADKKNALTVAMYEALVAGLQRGCDDDQVRVLHIRGSGGSFTAGNDLMDFMNAPPAGEDSPVVQFLNALADCPKPIVAEVSGVAIGIGVTMLLHCDLCYADETARFKMPFVDLGLCPEGASSLLLPRLMGQAKACELLLFSEKFDAARAEALGLITAVVDSKSLASHAQGKARALALKAPASVRATKSLLRRATQEAVKDTIRAEGDLFLKQLKSDEAREAFTAFFEKREPDFSSF